VRNREEEEFEALIAEVRIAELKLTLINVYFHHEIGIKKGIEKFKEFMKVDKTYALRCTILAGDFNA
jgi:hypothetical protein